MADYGLGIAALSYVAIDYLRIVWPAMHSRLQPLLWISLSLAAAARAPFYPHWHKELRSALPFVACLLFMLSCLVVEAISVQFVTSVLGIDWHWSAQPLPDVGQWIFLALNDRLPGTVVQFLRAPIVGLHHYLMLFIMLGFSVLFGCVKAPGLGLGARYMFTMGIGRLLRVLTFVGTILPSARPWCASARFQVPAHPHPWAQKYYIPYASNPTAVSELLRTDTASAPLLEDYPEEYVPSWGRMQFLANFLRPMEPGNVETQSWFNTLKRAGGGCNDLVFSGHILVSVLTAMAWTEAYPGWSSAFIWLLVLHSAQREIRERHHYTVDCVAGIYVGILLWRITSFIWSARTSDAKALKRLQALQNRVLKAAKDGDLDAVRSQLEKKDDQDDDKDAEVPKWTLWVFGACIIAFALSLVLLAFHWTADG